MNALLKKMKRWIAGVVIASMTLVSNAQTITYFHNDVAGSPLVATDVAGNVVWKETYKPYGEKVNNQVASSDNKIGYAGKPFDDNTGLTYMGARYYDPVVGRFVGVDSVGVNPFDLHSFNRYAYANNNPYRYVDPDGKWAQEVVVGLIILTVVYAAGTQSQRDSIDRGARALSQLVFSEKKNPPSEPVAGENKDSPASIEGGGDASGTNNTKPPLSDYKDALDKVHDKVGKLPKGEPGKFGSPQAGDSRKGYRLDPPHDGKAEGDAESKHHFNWWDYSRGKKGKGGEHGAIPIGGD